MFKPLAQMAMLYELDETVRLAHDRWWNALNRDGDIGVYDQAKEVSESSEALELAIRNSPHLEAACGW